MRISPARSCAPGPYSRSVGVGVDPDPNPNPNLTLTLSLPPLQTFAAPLELAPFSPNDLCAALQRPGESVRPSSLVRPNPNP